MVMLERTTPRPGSSGARQLVWTDDLDPDSRASLPHPIDDFGGVGSEQEAYKLAPLIARVATALIEARPNWLGHLRQFSLCYLWTPTLGGARGTLKWWEVVVPKKLLLWVLKRDEQPELACAQALVVLSVAACREAKLTWWEFESLIYAILRCLEDNDEGSVRVKPLSEEVEAEVASLYGPWSPRLKRLAEALSDGPAYQERLAQELAAMREAAKAEGRAEAREEAKAEVRERLAEALR